MKILSAEKIREADAYTIKHEPIKSIDLMERAGTLCFDWLYQAAPKLFPKSVTEESDWVFYVVCGVGNNGGDGLVIARLLQRNGYNVEVVVVEISDKPSKDFTANLDKLGKGKKSVTHVHKEKDVTDFPDDAIIIDCIFGTGLDRPVEGIALQVVKKINACHSTVVSIDMPSGLLDGDNSKNDLAGIVRSDYVLTFQVPKLSFFLAENAVVVGQVEILDIGLHPGFMDSVEPDYHYFMPNEAVAMRKQRPLFSHKGTYGHALIIGGAYGKWGAAILSATACMRTGAGLVTSHIGKAGANLILQAMPEIMISADESETKFTNLPELAPYNAIGVGPGIGKAEETVRALKLLIQEAKVPLVLDADALNILSDNPTWLSFLPKGSILTPHPGEFARLTGEKLSHFDSIEKQRELSRKHGVFILLKGAHSSLSFPDGRVLINSSGNPGMASGGMGDALTGIITGLLASGYNPLEAAALAMFVHGRAGDLALKNQSVESLVATDLIENIGNAFESLTHVK